MSVLGEIQKKLAVPKGQFNDFGGFVYRSAEDILSAVKPLLPEDWYILTTTEPRMIGNYLFQTCTAILTDGVEEFTAAASAREPEAKKGMDASQISGATISYAKKYALGNLFAIDNERDSDARVPDDIQEEIEKSEKPDYSGLREAVNAYAKATGKDVNQTKHEVWGNLPKNHTQKDIDKLVKGLKKKTEAAELANQVADENPDLFDEEVEL